MEVTSDQMGELNKEWVDERARCIPQNDGLLLCEGQIYPLCDTVGEEYQAAVAEGIKTRSLGCSCATHNRRFMSSGEMPDNE